MKVAKKPVAALVQNERSTGTILSQLNEKGNGLEKKSGEEIKPSLKIVIKEDKLLTTKYDHL